MIIGITQGEETKLHPEEIGLMILLQMKETAEAYLGGKANDAVVTVHAYLNDPSVRRRRRLAPSPA